MKKCLLQLLVLLLASAPVFAQTTVSGRVTNSADGQALPGVSVLVKGTANGTTTDTEGRYSISTDPTATLVFSFIGFSTQEIAVGSRTTVDVTLEEDVTRLNEVVVTALGIERDTKSLGYSVSNVKGEEFTKAREINVANALVGKIAGVNSTAPSTGAGGSSRVTIRGNSSLGGNNQPLYVVNGIQMNNDNLGNASEWGGSDSGDGISSINPDDIENITVLKGGAAAALYGQRGRNGVILITTKSGKRGQGLGIEFNSNTTIEKINNFTDFQSVYGQGVQGIKPSDVGSARNSGLSSWGPRLDGSDFVAFDGNTRPYTYRSKDNLDKFYETGHTYTNTLAISGGNDFGAFRLSIGRLANTSVYPNSEYNRTTGNLDMNYKLSSKWSGAANFNYTKEDGNRSNLSDAPGNGNYAILFLPPNFDASWLAPGYDPITKEETQYSSNAFDTNPYFAANRFRNNTNKDRLLSVASIRFAPVDWLYIQARIANDYFSFRRQSITPTGTAYRPVGSIDALQTTNFNEMNADILIGMSKDITPAFSLSASIGGNLLKQSSDVVSVDARDLAFPFIYNPSTAASRNANLSQPRREVQSIYASAEMGYKNMLFLTLTDRNDWSSTLPLNNNSYNYPSAAASFVFTEAVTVPTMDFGKLRVGVSRVGGDADPFQTLAYYSTLGSINGRPIGNFSNLTTNGPSPNVIPNANIEPLQVEEIEIGAELKFFENRLFVDAAWYNKQTLNDIVQASVSQTSGYDFAVANIGKIENKGFEFLVGGSPVRSSKFTWTTTFNYSNNKNKVISLAEGQKAMSVAQARTQRGFINHIVGEPFSQVMAFDYARNDDGSLTLDESGLPTASGTLTAMGTGVHPITGGWSNDFTFGNFNLNFLIDFKSGAVIYSGTNARAYSYGLHKETLKGREEGISVGGETNTAQNYYTRLADISTLHVYDADFIKFRSISITYNIPAKFFNGVVKDLSISLVGRNLFYIKKNTPNIDPESNYTNSNAQGLEYGGLPTVKTYGININAKF
ncbi:SusC/RagA family TonB-linked outer membrane protein [Chryseosolibacter indicus]|uniref:SusC/RagA family TonB-linked outer membrane protein n=1 Tax=Chryseosolibacter indicus TaxID=2782351 RepID=A0ABS5VLA3_9BACT|nr:SusC/RagA family TonB-linked outer membrane protein [Chryseosolibacter indicus]MBT1702156.1 SusC/RagA family TonB-linked outer membrane protein [Chryseosolibacter indicus]